MGERVAWMLVVFLAAATSAGALTEHKTSRVSTAIWAVDNPAALAEAMDVATNFTAGPEHFAAADKDPSKEFPADPSKAHMVNEGMEGGRKLSQSTAAANDVWQKIRDLVQDVCVQQSGKVCDEIELTGSSDWWKYYFPHKPLIDVTAGATQVAITTSAKVAASQLSKSEHYCAYDARSSTVCTLAGKTDSSSSVTQTSTSTFTFSGKVGYVIKVKTSASDTTWEHTLDFGYSLSESKATTRLVGQATTGSVIVPMKPEDKSCVVIEVVMERAKMGGIFNVFAEATGWIGVRQRDDRNWKIDPNRDVEYQYRALSFAGLVAIAKQLNIRRANEWTISSNGNAQLRTQINLDLDLATRSYANPQKYPNTDSRCARASRRLAAVTAPESSATLAQAPAVLPQQTPGSSGRQLMAGAPTPQKTMRENMEAMVQAWCKYQSGKQCDVLDFDGTTEWWRTDFYMSQPTTISTGLELAKLVQGSQTVAPRTVAAMLCPYRPFPYSCKLDEQSISSITQTTTAGSSWNFGQTAKLTALYGFDFLGNGVMAGLTVSMSTSFSFSDSTAEAKTESSASIQSYQVNMDPSQGRQCLYMSNKLQVLNMKATQIAWMKVEGRVGTQQNSRTRWRTDVSGSDGHYYRSTAFSTMVATAISLKWPEARYWTIKNGAARVEVPIELQVDLGTNGTAASTYYPDGTPDCTFSSQSAPLPSPVPSPSPYTAYTGNLVDYFVPRSSPGMKVCGTSNAANMLVLSRTGSLMNGASVAAGRTLPVEAFRSTATSTSSSTADWILAGGGTPLYKMVQLRVTSSFSSSLAERCVYITAVAAGYGGLPAGKALDQTTVNEMWRNRVTHPVATCVDCLGYGVSALAIPNSNCAAPPGFAFYPAMDSDDGDIGNFLAGGNDAASLAELCKTKPTCKAFNSDGWLKDVLKPRSQWDVQTSVPCKGLYVRL